MSQAATSKPSVQLCGHTTFAFNGVIRRAVQYLQKSGNEHQIQYLPESYPYEKSQMEKLDIAVRAKILKCHLEDAFCANRFSVSILRETLTIKITHDGVIPEIETIVSLYTNSDRIQLERM